MSANNANNADFDSTPEAFRGTRSQVGPFLAALDEEFKAQPDVFSSDHAKVRPPHRPPSPTSLGAVQNELAMENRS